MQEVAALLLCKLGGMSGTASEIAAVITAAGGGEPNEAQIATLISDVEGKDVSELLGLGMEKLKDVPMGGGGGGGGGGGVGGGGDGPKAAVKEVEEEVEEAPPAVDSEYLFIVTAST